ncbi:MULTISPECIES: MFS transporter [Methylobacterium]|jgi:MFS family permease|uniref:MFS transporter n=2 Tax=Methylobacterium TaxID=407 RepID=A0A0C6FA89_9HYPH|nr:MULTISPECIES: MFS transporter [Methylobacterium]MBK3399463.1 MHS family MFS transporter [Methylobacterium ajmalii]MBK3407006.1 MHS family MFS transporter [Methylobacterium ajmalii]MBK3423893.1 MHS family MFS transporter [Methylobacterium ajmalii]MBZ6411384.1 MHS family MFS transporter [Methylobacterium sp.]SFE56564.1 Sugar transporter [Methylobacterium sp. yr596]
MTSSVYPAPAAAVAEPEAVKTPKKAALASWIGSAVEYYDFFIYGTAAALIFPKLFFAPNNPQAAAIASFATFGVAYITRPLGAVALGHIGDRFGRKKVLTFTLLLMGLSTFMIGCLPTYDQLGILSPILLVIARLLQGVSAAGEQAGANSMTLEHAPAHKRAFFTSFTLSGTQAGLILATLVFLPITQMPEAQMLSWGWRIPFFLSALVVAVGFWVRRTLPETPVFEKEQETQAHAKADLPVAVLFRTQWADVLRVIFAALVSVVSTIFSVFTLSYAVNTMKIDRPTMLTVLILANVVALGAIPAFAALADRIGRRPVFIFGALGSAALIWPYMWAISQGNIPLIFTFGILLSGVVYSAANGVWPSLYGEMFDTKVRLSGMAIGTQIGFALGGFAPVISAALLGDGPTGWVPVAAFVTVTAGIAAVSIFTARETYRTPMELLGKR